MVIRIVWSLVVLGNWKSRKRETGTGTGNGNGKQKRDVALGG